MAAHVPAHNTYLERENRCILSQNSNSVMRCCIDMDVLRCSCVSFSNLCLMMVMAGSTVTDVRRAFTSYGEIHSPSHSLMDLTLSTKSWVFLMS